MSDQTPAPRDPSPDLAALFSRFTGSTVTSISPVVTHVCQMGELIDPRDVASIDEWGHAG